jgi:hypothetical protein
LSRAERRELEGVQSRFARFEELLASLGDESRAGEAELAQVQAAWLAFRLLLSDWGRFRGLRDEGDVEAAEAEAAELERRLNPRTPADFAVLYNEVEEWKTAEKGKIEAAGLEERDRLEALAQLLHKETKLLQSIDGLKLKAAKANRKDTVSAKLEEMSTAKAWAMGDGEVASVHTPFTIRAKELRDLYSGLTAPRGSHSVEERLEVLLHVKWTVKEFDCGLTREIVELVDREADMLNRGRKQSSLAGLRKRLANLFLQFVETPEFNPEAARYQPAPRDVMGRPELRPTGAKAR